MTRTHESEKHAPLTLPLHAAPLKAELGKTVARDRLDPAVAREIDTLLTPRTEAEAIRRGLGWQSNVGKKKNAADERGILFADSNREKARV